MCSSYPKDKISHSLLLSISILILAAGTFLSGCAKYKAYSGLSGHNALHERDSRTALTQYQEALRMCEKDNFKRGVVLNLINVGCSFGGLGEYSKALDNYKKGLDLAYEINYKKPIPYAVLNIAITSATIGDFDTATHYLHKLNINDFPNDLKSYFWAIKGKIYVDKERYELGLDYEMKGLELAKSKTNLEKQNKAELIEDIALSFLKKGDYKNAYQYATDSSKLLEESGFPARQWKTRYILGKCFERRGNDQEAKKFYNESASKIKEIKAKLSPKHKKYLVVVNYHVIYA